MNRYAFFLAAAPVLALTLGCGPISRGGGGGAGGSTAAATTGTGGAGSGGGSGGSAAAQCGICGEALTGDAGGALCGASQTAYASLLDCACNSVCASVCGDGGSGNCLDAWNGNMPVECKLCLVSATGCGAAWDACVGDDGTTPAPTGSGSASSGGSSCTCDPALPLCPGGGGCATPGPFDGPGNAACGSAQYCAPCCDPGNACATQGTCAVTKIAETPCAAGYECCSGVCSAGKCQGGCGVVLSF